MIPMNKKTRSNCFYFSIFYVKYYFNSITFFEDGRNNPFVAVCRLPVIMIRRLDRFKNVHGHNNIPMDFQRNTRNTHNGLN